MKYSDVFVKSDLGRNEIKYHTLGILPREARTLLIMIDGKRNYQSYLDTLDNGKMFVEFGGVTPLLELLLELDCIEIIGQKNAKAESVLEPKPEPQAIKAEISKESSEAEFDRTFNQSQVNMTTIDKSTESRTPNASYESTKSELAAYIEHNALPEEAWGYLLSLEQCNNPSELLALVKEIHNSPNRALSQGMKDFSEKIIPHIQ